ncbi:MAG: hypothetical protein ACXWV6_08360 [Chitinophagaceae bacterium]
MAQRETILRELNELESNLADSGFQNVYQAPAGYFEGLASEILKRVKALEAATATEELETLSPLLSAISKKMPHSVPEGYFDTLGKKLEQAISPDSEQTAKEELESLSPFLSELKSKETYGVPVGYFENLQPAFNIERAGSNAKVVSITSRKWFRYAAAALVIGFVATMAFLIRDKKDIDPSNKSYAWVKKNLKKVSTDDINEFVELANAETTDIAKVEAKDEIDNLLKDVSDKEIQEFLNETQLAEPGTDDDLILN